MARIRTYCRIKPSLHMWETVEASDTEVLFSLPDSQCSSSSQRKSKSAIAQHAFAFSHVFDHSTQQEEVFDNAAKGIVQGFLDGFNGTIFAYGQTGSGKTHTVEGSARRFDERGLAPRAISMIYQDLERRSSSQLEFQVHVSYMEIYQESGYDLLTSGARSSPFMVTPFPKVTVTDGVDGTCVFRNLSLHQSASEEVAQALLFHGQANRKVAETSMNAQSSRSHSIFSIQLTTKNQTNNTIVRSKLHLVDLAGSECVAKTGTQGRHLVEAKYINLSLHHLEGVIIALHTDGPRAPPPRPLCRRPKSAPYGPSGRRSRVGRPFSASSSRGNSSSTPKHVPYRNSLLTMVLRDSIGGNCQTAMIATIAMEAENLAETLSTCRFAQRVACITNVTRKNEEIDDKVIIQRLRHRISELEAEVCSLKSDHQGSPRQEDSSVGGWELGMSREDEAKYSRLLQACLGGVAKEILSERRQPLQLQEWLSLIKSIIASFKSPEDEHEQDEESEGKREEGEGGDRSRCESAILFRRAKSAPSSVAQAINPDQVLSAGLADSNPVENLDRFAQQLTNTLPGARPRSGRRGRRSDAAKNQQKTGGAATIRKGSNYHRETEPRRVGSAGSSRAKGSRSAGKVAPLSPRAPVKAKISEDELTPDERDLQLKQLQLQETQLLHIKKELTNGIEIGKEQISQQGDFLARLREKSGANELVTQEKVVLKQLRKKQMRAERRLRLVDEQLMSLSNIQEAILRTNSIILDPDETMVKTRISTVQEEDEAFLSSRSDRAATCHQVGLKEAVTRQKLMEFREKLQQSRLSQQGRNSLNITGQPISVRASPVKSPEQDEEEKVEKCEETENTNDQPSPPTHEMTEQLSPQRSQTPITQTQRKNMFGLSTAAIRLHEQPQQLLVKPPPRKSPTQHWSDVYTHKPSTEFTRESLVATVRHRRIGNEPIQDPEYGEVSVDSILPTEDPAGENLPSARMEKSIQDNFSMLKGHLMEKIAEYCLSKDTMDGSSGYKSDSNPVTEPDLSDQDVPPHADLEERWRIKLKCLLEQNPEFMLNDHKEEYNKGRTKKGGKGNFDDTLKKMLTAAPGSTKVTYPHAHYDTFARVPSIKKKSKGDSDEKGKKEQTTELWGPEAKKRSVGGELREFLESNENSGIPSFSEFPLDLSEVEPQIRAMASEDEREETFVNYSRQQRHRVQIIRQVTNAAEVIQRHWRKHKQQTA